MVNFSGKSWLLILEPNEAQMKKYSSKIPEFNKPIVRKWVSLKKGMDYALKWVRPKIQISKGNESTPLKLWCTKEYTLDQRATYRFW